MTRPSKRTVDFSGRHERQADKAKGSSLDKPLINPSSFSTTLNQRGSSEYFHTGDTCTICLISPRNRSSSPIDSIIFLVEIERGGRGILATMKYSVRGDEASRGVLSEIRGLLSAQEKLVTTSPLRNPLFRSHRNLSFKASRSASRIMSKNLSDAVLDTLNIRPASSKDTRRAAKTMTAISPNFPTSFPVSSARFTTSFSRSDNRRPFFSKIRFTSSSDKDRTPILTAPHSGHFTTFDRSFTTLISE